jgi:hypothetical protein
LTAAKQVLKLAKFEGHCSVRSSGFSIRITGAVTPSKDREIKVFTNSFSVVFVNAAAGGDQTNFLSRRVVGMDWRGLI